jgi:hypothetical protein
MSVPLAVVVQQQFEAAFAPPRAFMVTFFRRMISEMVSPVGKIAVLDPQRKRKRREELNALLASNSEKTALAMLLHGRRSLKMPAERMKAALSS